MIGAKTRLAEKVEAVTAAAEAAREQALKRQAVAIARNEAVAACLDVHWLQSSVQEEYVRPDIVSVRWWIFVGAGFCRGVVRGW